MALALDATHLKASELKIAEMPSADRVEFARKLVKAHPNEADAWKVLARSLEDDEERTQVWRETLSLSPRDVDALIAVSSAELRGNRSTAALALISVAVEQSPWNAEALYGQSLILAALGQCTESDQAAQRAIAVLVERASPEAIEQLRTTSAKNHQDCLTAHPR